MREICKEETNRQCYAVQRTGQRRFRVYKSKRPGVNWTMQPRSQGKWIVIDTRVQQNVVYNANDFERQDANAFVLLEGGQGSKYELRHLPPPVASVANCF